MRDSIIMTKYRGFGNDYLVLDAKKNQLQLQGKKLRFFASGDSDLERMVCFTDQLTLMEKWECIFLIPMEVKLQSVETVSVFLQNILWIMSMLQRKKFAIETLSGTIEVECLNARATEFRVNMGKASFLSREIPVTGEVREVIDEPFTFNKKEYKATCLTVGNPHCIIFMDQVSQEKVRELGPYVENADEFPERVNLQICRQIDKGNLDIEIWERGSGYTKASGTGSCAAAIAAYRKGLMENRINVNQPGGMIQIDIKEDGTIFMTGTVGYIAEMSVAESFFS